MESFDSTKKGLYEILKGVGEKIQLPVFRRAVGWITDKGILPRIPKSFPMDDNAS
jgi:hypothetical protein